MTLSGVVGFQRSRLAWATVRSVGMAVLLIVAYYLIPVERHPHQSVVLRLTVAMVVFVAVLANEVRSIVSHDEPMLRAGVSMATVIPLFLVLFAWVFLTMSHSNPGSFSSPLDRTSALYFTMTVFSPVGFGDIVPRTDPARAVAMVQMAADLMVIAVVVRLIFGAASSARTPKVPA
jgi:Ion channel